MANSANVQIASRNCFHNPFPQLDFHIQLPKVDLRPLFQKVAHAVQEVVQGAWRFRDHAIQQLTLWDNRLDTLLPNFPIQNRIDQLTASLQKKFAPLVAFNNWLNSNGHGAWYKQLAQFLVKLPLKAVRNIVQQLFTIISGLAYGVVHPLKALNKLAQLLVAIPFELTKPETWSQMGAGMVGTSLGNAAVTGGLFSLIGVGIGGAMLVGGVSIGTLKTALQAKEGERLEAASQYLLEQSRVLSETLATSFCMGIIVGVIRKVIQEQQTRAQNERVQNERVQNERVQNEQKSRSPEPRKSENLESLQKQEVEPGSLNNWRDLSNGHKYDPALNQYVREFTNKHGLPKAHDRSHFGSILSKNGVTEWQEVSINMNWYDSDASEMVKKFPQLAATPDQLTQALQQKLGGGLDTYTPIRPYSLTDVQLERVSLNLGSGNTHMIGAVGTPESQSFTVIYRLNVPVQGTINGIPAGTTTLGFSLNHTLSSVDPIIFRK